MAYRRPPASLAASGLKNERYRVFDDDEGTKVVSLLDQCLMLCQVTALLLCFALLPQRCQTQWTENLLGAAKLMAHVFWTDLMLF